MKRAQVSPVQAFQEFDDNGDGVLTKAEFHTAMYEKLRIYDMTTKEFEILWESLDADHSGTIDYKEFVRKLEQYGVKNLSKEEFILLQMIKACHKSNISMAQFFDMFDKKGRGYFSREDFKDIFNILDLKINESEQNTFIDNFWKDKTAGIDYKSFLRIFAKLEIQVSQGKKSTEKNQAVITDATIKIKKKIFDEIQAVLIE